MSVTFRIEQQSATQVTVYLESITPRLIVAFHREMKEWEYAGASLSAQKYFAASQSVERGSRNTGDLLISRTGTLRRSVIASADSGMTPASPDATTTTITATWGAATPYARIQEYGGYAGRGHRAYIPPRPYLQPALEDSRGELMAALRAAVQEALATT